MPKMLRICKNICKRGKCPYGCTWNATNCHKDVRHKRGEGHGCKFGAACKYAHIECGVTNNGGMSLKIPSPKTPEDADNAENKESEPKCSICYDGPLEYAFKHQESNDSHFCACKQCIEKLSVRQTEDFVRCPICKQTSTIIRVHTYGA